MATKSKKAMWPTLEVLCPFGSFRSSILRGTFSELMVSCVRKVSSLIHIFAVCNSIDFPRSRSNKFSLALTICELCQVRYSIYLELRYAFSGLIGHFGKYHNTPCLSPQILHKHRFQFLLGRTMVPRENKNNAYAKFEGTNKDCYGIFRNGLFFTQEESFK